MNRMRVMQLCFLAVIAAFISSQSVQLHAWGLRCEAGWMGCLSCPSVPNSFEQNNSDCAGYCDDFLDWVGNYCTDNCTPPIIGVGSCSPTSACSAEYEDCSSDEECCPGTFCSQENYCCAYGHCPPI